MSLIGRLGGWWRGLPGACMAAEQSLKPMGCKRGGNFVDLCDLFEDVPAFYEDVVACALRFVSKRLFEKYG